MWLYYTVNPYRRIRLISFRSIPWALISLDKYYIELALAERKCFIVIGVEWVESSGNGVNIVENEMPNVND